MTAPTDILVILDGDLTSVVGAAMVRDELLGSEGARAWAVVAPGTGAAAPLRRSAALDTAEAFGLAIAGQQHADESQNQLLVRAVEMARERGIQRVLWPIHAGGAGMVDLDEAARLVHRGMLASRMVQLAHGDAQPILMRADLIDLADEQVAELVLDVDAPVRLAWWWDARLAARMQADQPLPESGLDAPAKLKVTQMRRWLPALTDAGIELGLRAKG